MTIKQEQDIWKSLKNAEAYYVSCAETPAHVAGWVLKAKRKDEHAADVIDEELHRVFATGLHYGYTEEELTPFMRNLREIYQFYLMKRWPDQDWPREHRED